MRQDGARQVGLGWIGQKRPGELAWFVRNVPCEPTVATTCLSEVGLDRLSASCPAWIRHI